MARKPVVYAIHVTHYPNGMVEIEVAGIGDSDADKEAVIYALENAIELLQDCDTENIPIQ